MIQLTPHFSLAEMTFSDTASRLGIPNYPDDKALENLFKTAILMEDIRELLGAPISVTSGYRSGYLNKLIGGSETSDHCKGLACDFKPVGRNLFDCAKAIEGSKLRYDQLILEFHATPQSGWIHVGIGQKMRRESFTKKTAKTPYITGLHQ